MRNLTLTTLRMGCTAAILAAVLMFMPLGVAAAGLGKLTVLSALGQTLRAEVDITASRDEMASLSARIASVDAFKQAGVEFTSALTTIRIAVEQRADGRPYLTMVSERPFNEPFLDLLIELNWSSGRLVREYTFLLDPPETAQKSIAAAAPVSAPTAIPAPAAVPSPPPVQTTEVRPVAPSPSIARTEVREAPLQQEVPGQPRPDLKVVRGSDGVQRIVKAEPVEAKAEKMPAQRLVKPGDTLGKIAKETKPEGVNLDQMLVALFRGNQDAFEGNVNRLKAGKILALPDREMVASVDAAEARKTLQAHAADFNAYSKKLASSVAAAPSQKDEGPRRAASGKITPQVEDKAPAVVPGKDKLEVSKSEQAAAGKAGAGRMAAIEETLIAREKALKEANSRIADLEKNLNDLKKLIELKNQGMAELQKQAQAGKPAATAKATTPEEAKKPATVADKPPEKSPEKAHEKAAEKAPEKPAEVPAAKTAEKSPEVAPIQPKPTAADKKTAVPPAAPPAAPVEPSFMDQSPEIVFGGGGILALLLFYFGYKRYQQRQQAKPDRSEAIEPSSRASHGTSATPSGDSVNLLSQNDFSNLSGVGPAQADVGVDPVAEADVYLAYGRDVQAEEILVDALKTDPTRQAIHLKLLEIYANRKSTRQFESIARELNTQTGGAGASWEKATKLGRQIDPSNPLYGAAEAPGKAFDPDATMVIAPDDAQIELGDLDLSAGPADQTASTDLNLDISATSEPSAPPAEELPVSLDFELDLAEPEAASAEPALAPESVAAVTEAAPGLDIDLGGEASEAQPATDVPLELPTETSSHEAEPLVTDFDLDMDLDAKTEAPAEPSLPPVVESNAVSDASGGLDFDFNLDVGEPVIATPAADPVPEPGDDSHSMDFDLELPAPAEKPAVASVDLSSISLDLGTPGEPSVAEAPVDTPDLDDAASQDVETKLELAQAYEEMGDKEGARELLQEVLNEGNAAQKETARSKLERLD